MSNKIVRINNNENRAKKIYLQKQVNIIPKNANNRQNIQNGNNTNKESINSIITNKNTIIKNNSKKNGKSFGEKSIKLVNIKSNNTSYNNSDLLHFLTFLCKKNLMNDVRVVCHSGIMKSFVKKIELLKKKKSTINKLKSGLASLWSKKNNNTIENNDSLENNNSIKNNDPLKNVVKKQNLWTLFLKNKSENKNFNISISRHAYTFANLLKEKGRSIEQTLEKDTQLSLYGILTALIHGNNLVSNEEINGLTSSPDLVYVSVLIRTWMTAICLYLPHNTSETFTLVISPFLKEEGSGYDNTPEEFNIQIANIIFFLKYLYELKVDNSIINNNLMKIKDFFNKGGNIRIVKLKETYNINLTDINKINKNNKKPINITSNYFNKRTNKNSDCNVLHFSEVKVFDGVEKLNPKKMVTSRWCEPFSKKQKFIGFGQNTCSSRMKSI